VYIESGDTQQALLDNLGRKLRDQADITLVFMLTGSCTLTPNIYGTGSGPVAIPANTSMLYIPSTCENSSWTPANGEYTCTTGSATPTPDLAIAALFPSSCSTYAPPAGTDIQQYIGPTQAYTFIVPSAEFTNGQTSITTTEAYYAFGDGASNPVLVNGAAEWNDPTNFFLRPTTKSTLVSTALNIGVTPAKMADVGADGGAVDGRRLLGSSTAVLDGIQTATSMQAIGILGDEVYDADPSRGTKENVLAFQDVIHGQTAAYYPDSTVTAYDKQNIRDGHYSLWSPDVYMTASTGGVPNNPTVKFILDVVLGNPNATLPDGGTTTIDGLAITASVGLTPSCAMQVQRTADGAPLTAYTPAAPCTCKFLSDIKTPVMPASCTTCTSNADCGNGGLGCFNGFCETAPVPYVPTTDAGACDNSTINNACTTATSVVKAGLVYPADDGGLLPISQ
jgi:hypothetical protein